MSLERSGLIFTGIAAGAANHSVCEGFRGWSGEEEEEEEEDKGGEGEKEQALESRSDVNTNTLLLYYITSTIGCKRKWV